MIETARKLRFTAVSILFFILISLAFLTVALENFSREDNMKNFIVDYSHTFLDNETEYYDEYEKHHANCQNGALEQTIEFSDENKTISCEKVLTTTKEKYFDVLVEEFVFKDLYKKNYPCTFIQCLTNKETIPVVFSEQGNYFLNNIKIFLLLGTIIITLLVAVLSQTIPAGFKNIGYVFAIVGAGYYFTKHLPIAEINLDGQSINPSLITNALISPIETAALIVFILGLILFLTGMILNYKRGEGLLAKIFKKK